MINPDGSYASDDECTGLLKQAFDVDLPENFDPDKVPETGEEYLHHVMYERSKLEACVHVDISQFGNKSIVLKTKQNPVSPPEICASKEWQTMKLAEFAGFRKFIETQLPEDESTIDDFEEDKIMETVIKEEPKFTDIAKYTADAKVRILEAISENLKLINKHMEKWIFAILAMLQHPLSPSFCNSLREFSRNCITLRNEKGGKDCSSLNLYICIIGRYFRQLDLADPYDGD